jgi:hypothetical protein
MLAALGMSSVFLHADLFCQEVVLLQIPGMLQLQHVGKEDILSLYIIQ